MSRRCKKRNENERPWIRGVRCELPRIHDGYHMAWVPYLKRKVKWWTN